MSKTPSSIQDSYFAIVSPCSSCNNQRVQPDSVNNLPACPRQRFIALQAALQANNQSTVQIDPLALTGNEDNSDTGIVESSALVNPVYSDALNTVMVWVAALTDNGPMYDNDGNQINPGLLDPAFDTTYINCKPYPVTPADNEAAYRAKGAWSESDQLKVHTLGSQQTSSDQPVLITGFADKVNFSYSAPRTPLERDYGIAGT